MYEATKQNNKNNKHIKSKRWWNADTEDIHNKLKQAEYKYKISEFKCQTVGSQVKLYKRQFRKVRRNIERAIKERQFIKLRTSFRTNRIQFWREAKNIQRSNETTFIKNSKLVHTLYFKNNN